MPSVVDYTLVGIVLCFCMGLYFMSKAFLAEYPNKIMHHFLAAILFYPAGQFYLMTSSAIDVPMHFIFYLLAVVNFFLFIAWSLAGYRIARRRREFGDPMDDEEAPF